MAKRSNATAEREGELLRLLNNLQRHCREVGVRLPDAIDDQRLFVLACAGTLFDYAQRLVNDDDFWRKVPTRGMVFNATSERAKIRTLLKNAL